VPEPFDLTNLGKLSEPEPYEVTAEAIAAYARATNDRADDSLSGQVAPAVFAIVPVFGRQSRQSIVVEERRDELAGRLVHGEQWMVLHRPIVAGDHLVVRGGTIGVHAKSSGVTVVSKMETTDSSGSPVNDQYVTVFYRGVESSLDQGEVAPTLKSLRGEEEGVALEPVTFQVDDDQPRRYADASGDHNRIHLDPDFARSVGLPGVIVHGMCTLALAARATCEAMGIASTSAVAQIGARFTRPLLPGEALTTTAFELVGGPGGAKAARFSCSNGQGEQVLAAGFVELRP